LTVLSSRLRLEEGNFDFHKIAQDTPGYVGADLVALTKEAASIAVNRIFSELESIAPLDKPSLNEEAMEEDEPMDTETSPTAGILTDTTIYTTRYKDQLKAKELQKRSNVSEMLRSNVAALTEEQMAPLSITMADFFEALKRVQPSSKREGFATIPNTTWGMVIWFGCLFSL
jgi:ribosome biogenesis ATPase